MMNSKDDIVSRGGGPTKRYAGRCGSETQSPVCFMMDLRMRFLIAASDSCLISSRDRERIPLSSTGEQTTAPSSRTCPTFSLFGRTRGLGASSTGASSSSSM